MNPLVEKIRRGLERDRELPLSERLAKGGRYAASAALAPLWLHGCNRVGKRARAIGRPRVENAGEIDLGDDVILNSTFAPVELEAGTGAQLSIGSGAAINFGTLIAAHQKVKLGDRVSVGPYCVIADQEAGDAQARPIEIGDGVWLASRVTVLPGSKIGAGSVVTAGSVVSGELPAGVVAGGMPARVLRHNGPAAEPTPVAEKREEKKPDLQTLHGTILADFTVGDLAARLRDAAEAPILEVADAPYCQVMQQLLSPPAENARDFALVWTRPELTSPVFQKLLEHEPAEQGALEADVDAFAARVRGAAKGYRFVFVPTWTLPYYRRGLGIIDARPPLGASWALAVMNARLMQQLADAPNVYVLDASRWLAVAGRAATSAKGWFTGKVLYQGEVLAEAARDLKAAVRGLLGQSRKLVVLDLDETLWGGIVGDVGWQNLRLGGHDPEGEALVAFQRGLKALTRRGVVLAIVSKNEESVALEAIQSHPEMVLRKDDFAGWRINWDDKARNLAELVKDLNLGLQSVVFLDDNPAERARVKAALPEVLVPDWPEDKLLYPQALDLLRAFDAPAISREDAERTRMYVTERAREELKRDVGSVDDWLRELQITVRAEPLSAANLPRTAQLFNKTNQMNLSTRRASEAELQSWAQAPNHALFTLTVGDRFGDAGLTGIVSVERDGDRARIVDFILSCRVFGRKIENAMVHLAVDWARREGATRVEARYLPTPKNKPTLTFFESSGLVRVEDGLYAWDATQPYPLPEVIHLSREVRS